MGRYLVRRTLFLILVLFIVSIVTFLIFVKLPASDPARRAAGRAATAEQIARARETFGLDRPVYIQYARFAKGLIPLPGFFLDEEYYFSYSNFIPVKEEIYKRLPVTIILALGAAVIWITVGIPIGVVSAIKRGSVADRSVMFFAIFGVSAPVFWLAYVLLYIFWFKLKVLPGSGIPADQSVPEAVLGGRFVLPWVALSLTFIASYARQVRGNLLETMSEDYIRTARAKGLTERKVIFRHGLRSTMTLVTTMVGLDLGTLLGGAVITETVFNLPGIGQYALRSIFTNDFPGVMGVTVFAAFFIIVANLIVDVLYAFLDPRIRYT